METKTILELFANSKLYTTKGCFLWQTIFPPKEVICFIHKLETAFLEDEDSIYDFGNFILEQNSNRLEIIDGAQRLIVISIFISTILVKLSLLRSLTDDEIEIFKTTLKNGKHYKLTLNTENQSYRDCVIDRIKTDSNANKTESGERLKKAFDYVTNFMNKKNESFATLFLQFIINATCKIQYDTLNK